MKSERESMKSERESMKSERDGCTGIQFALLMILSARRKLLKRDETRRSCLKSFWKSSWGSTFHAIVSDTTGFDKNTKKKNI